MEQSTSAAVPVVQGFTPINQGSPNAALAEPTAAVIPVGNGDKKGKKRSRKVSISSPTTSKATNGTRQKKPKKSKQMTAPANPAITKAFPVTKPRDEGWVAHHKSSEDFSPSTVREATVQTCMPYRDALPPTEIETSSRTVRQSSPTAGLSSTYNAAFEQKEQNEQNAVADRRTESNGFEKFANNGTRSAIIQAEFEPLSPPTFLGDLLLDSKGLVPTGRNDIAEAQCNPGVSGRDPLCQIPCSPGILDEPIGPDAMTSPRACLGQELEELDTWELTILETDLSSSTEPGVAGVNHNIDQEDRPDVIADPTNIDDAELSILMEQFTNVEGEASKVPAEHLIDPADLSFSSDVDLTVSSPGEDTKFSSDFNFFRSSSPSLQSHSDLQPCSPKEEVSAQSPITSGQASIDDIDDDTYNDEDLEAVLQGFDSPPSAQVPASAPSIPLRQAPAKEPRCVLSDVDINSAHNVATSPKRQAASRIPGLMAPPPPKAKDLPHKVAFDQNGTPIPFVRSPFPPPVRDRSPIIGLSSGGPVLRTCFRIGEALNAGSTALRTKTNAIIEMYARVVCPERPTGSLKQYFQFADLFSPERPPILKGTYGLWKGVELWDLDSKVFMGEKGKGKMARVVGRVVREEKTRSLEMTILSIWEADWDDVGICKGHYCG
ncbi:MAG: hypothetical protein L6R39_006526 [Caloplaca ligustica]|nr:MAG: hypothetical protein L6R39_006526 [Caloplaca ligustica]